MKTAHVQPGSEPVELVTRSEADTRRVAKRLAQVLAGGERIGLSGELGAGKTCFVRGLAEGLGVPLELVRSPSFTIVLPYHGGRLPLYHVDLFRMQPGEEDRLALREYLYGDGVCAIEWFENLGEPLVDFLSISLTFVGASSRRLVAAGHGVGYHPMLQSLREMKIRR